MGNNTQNYNSVNIKNNTTADQSDNLTLKRPIEIAPRFVDMHTNGEKEIRKQILGAGNKKTATGAS